MNKYEVYLTTEKTVCVNAQSFEIDRNFGIIQFIVDHMYIATFIMANISGFMKVDEFKEE